MDPLSKLQDVKSQRPWLRRRGYAHFDFRPSESKVEAVVSDPAAIARHSFLPLLEKDLRSKRWVQKDGGSSRRLEEKVRVIRYASHMDAAIYSYYAHSLGAIYERYLKGIGAAESVIAYRKLSGRSNVDFALEAFREIQKRGECAVLAVDVKSFFDRIPHTGMKGALKSVLGVPTLTPDWYAVFKNITRYSSVSRAKLRGVLGRDIPRRWRPSTRVCTPKELRDNREQLLSGSPNRTGVGIPQGTPASAVFSNVFMAHFDGEVAANAGQLGWYYRRYCDDILIVADRDQMQSIEDSVSRLLGAIGLEVNTLKTQRYLCRGKSVFVAGDDWAVKAGGGRIDYLGMQFDGALVGLRESTLRMHQDRMQGAVKGVVARFKATGEWRKRKLFARHSHLGVHCTTSNPARSPMNFVGYGLRAKSKASASHSWKFDKRVGQMWGELHQLLVRGVDGEPR